MFRSSTIIRELALNLAKVIFTLKHSVKLCRYLLCGCVAVCHGMRGLYAVQNATEVTFCVVCCAECDFSRILHSIQHTRHSMTCCHTTA